MMENMPEVAQSLPPPPPPWRSRKGLWVGFAIGAVVLCLSCIVIGIGVYFFGSNIPYLSNFFPSPTSPGLFYSNPAAGISLTYPGTWQYAEKGDAANGFNIVFASSTDILNNPTNAPQAGAAMAIYTNFATTGDFPFSVDASSLGNVVEYIASMVYTNISNGQNLRTFTLSGYPAASGVYTLTGDAGDLYATYLIAVLRNDEMVVFVGVCPQAEWAQYQPAFDSIVNSAAIVQP